MHLTGGSSVCLSFSRMLRVMMTLVGDGLMNWSRSPINLLLVSAKKVNEKESLWLSCVHRGGRFIFVRPVLYPCAVRLLLSVPSWWGTSHLFL